MSDAIRSFSRESTYKVLTPEQEKRIHESCLTRPASCGGAGRYPKIRGSGVAVAAPPR
jgi:hypothetical protein